LLGWGVGQKRGLLGKLKTPNCGLSGVRWVGHGSILLPQKNFSETYEIDSPVFRDTTLSFSKLQKEPPMSKSLDTFSQINRERCESPRGFNHALGSWSLSDWATALSGEVGEMCNIIKKLNRVRDGIPGNKETPDQLRLKLKHEIADVYTYLDLLTQAAGIDLSEAVWEKFDAKSQEIGYTGSTPAPEVDYYAGITLPEPPPGYRRTVWGELTETTAVWFDPAAEQWVLWGDVLAGEYLSHQPRWSIFAVPVK
jgi:NTP pyrophosphatase (non-canonical NTP hydrolase)